MRPNRGQALISPSWNAFQLQDKHVAPAIAILPFTNCNDFNPRERLFLTRLRKRELSEPVCRYSIGMYLALDTAPSNIMSSYRATIPLCISNIILAIKISSNKYFILFYNIIKNNWTIAVTLNPDTVRSANICWMWSLKAIAIYLCNIITLRSSLHKFIFHWYK